MLLTIHPEKYPEYHSDITSYPVIQKGDLSLFWTRILPTSIFFLGAILGTTISYHWNIGDDQNSLSQLWLNPLLFCFFAHLYRIPLWFKLCYNLLWKTIIIHGESISSIGHHQFASCVKVITRGSIWIPLINHYKWIEQSSPLMDVN